MPISFLASSSAWKNSLILNDLIPGSYKYRFVAVDNDNRYSFDLINITVSDKNLSPIAVAGYPQKVYPIGTFHLDGGMSYDRDGSIVSYLWKFKSGPNKPLCMRLRLLGLV